MIIFNNNTNILFNILCLDLKLFFYIFLFQGISLIINKNYNFFSTYNMIHHFYYVIITNLFRKAFLEKKMKCYHFIYMQITSI